MFIAQAYQWVPAESMHAHQTNEQMTCNGKTWFLPAAPPLAPRHTLVMQRRISETWKNDISFKKTGCHWFQRRWIKDNKQRQGNCWLSDWVGGWVWANWSNTTASTWTHVSDWLIDLYCTTGRPTIWYHANAKRNVRPLQMIKSFLFLKHLSNMLETHTASTSILVLTSSCWLATKKGNFETPWQAAPQSPS